MKKTLSLILASLMLSGTLAASVGAADERVTILKAVKAELSYEMVVPETSTVGGAGTWDVGAAAVSNVENATEKTVIYYTAEGSSFKTSDGSAEIPASYFFDSGDPLVPTEEIVVYEEGAAVTSPPFLHVEITSSDWASAPAGTYTATVTYTFDRDVEMTFDTVQDILDTVPGALPEDRYHPFLDTTDFVGLIMTSSGESRFLQIFSPDGKEIITSEFDISAAVDETSANHYVAGNYTFIVRRNKLSQIVHTFPAFDLTFDLSGS